MDADDTLHTYAMAENVLDIVVALYSFTSTNDQELSFEKGDRLEILDRPPSDPEWYKARSSHGQIGLVPRNYLQVSAFREKKFCLLLISTYFQLSHCFIYYSTLSLFFPWLCFQISGNTASIFLLLSYELS